MRYAILADVHGNLEALRAVLADADEWGAERIVVAGDIVGYGADPDACIAVLEGRGALCVLGNHEEMVLGRRDFSHCVHAGIRAARWTHAVLSQKSWNYLQSLPSRREYGELLVCHGDLDDAGQYVVSAERARATLVQMSERHQAARMLVLGHTHRALAVSEEEYLLEPRGRAQLVGHRRWLINPGAVGQARDGQALARYARYDEGRAEVEFMALSYDVATSLRKLRAHGLVARVAVSHREGRIDALRTRFARTFARPLPGTRGA